MIRQPIVAVLGHVDHGKTTLLDRIRGSAVAKREAGGITQHIGATEIPIATLAEVCGPLMERLGSRITLPGLLFIDTPGHAAFTTLRKRGGALSDLAVLVVDVMEGFQPQTIEALSILKAYKTPFLVAANKIDRIQGWRPVEGSSFIKSFQGQEERVKEALDYKIYELVGKLYEQGFQAERFDRVEKFERQVSIVPVSALTGEGVPDLLMLLLGLAQRFLEKKLEVEVTGPAKGTILEVKEEVGLGVTLDVIIYDGKIKRGDTIVAGGKKGPIVTKVRSLLKPKPLDEIRDPRFKFDAIKEASASCGVKISGPNLEGAMAGTPLRGAPDPEKAKAEVQAEMEEVRIETEKAGVVVKADTLGALEALVQMLKAENIPIRMADVGDISRRDVIEAETVRAEAPTRGAILAFNVKPLKDAEERARETGVQILSSDVTYKLVGDYKKWVLEAFEMEKRREFERLHRPARIRIIPGYVFRTSKPAIVGIEILSGTLRTKCKMMKEDGTAVGQVKGLQDRNENIGEAKKGMQVAMAIEGPTVGRQILEGDVLLVELSEPEAKILEAKFRDFLAADEAEAFEEVKKVKRKGNPFWALGE